MEKIEKYTYEVENKKHLFYCDDCNKFLGESCEYEDGYYETIGECTICINIFGNWMTAKKCLCNECKEKYFSKVEKKLRELGFK